MNHGVKASSGTTVPVELPDALPDGQLFEAVVDGKRVQCRWHRALGHLQVVENGVERNLNVRHRAAANFDGEAATSVAVELIAGSAKGMLGLEAQVTPAVPGQEGRKTATAAAGLVVRSQITGKVLKVLVKVGDAVEPGQTLLVIEAMKMENRVFSAAKGTVQVVGVKDGDQVAVGKELVRLAP